MSPGMTMLNLILDKDEKYLCIVCGVILIKDVKEVHELLIFILGEKTGTYDYSYTRKVNFSDACNEAFFQVDDLNSLLFFTRD